MRQKSLLKTMLLLCALIVGSGSAWAVDEVSYTLTPVSGSNNGYANNCDIEINGITWNMTGNSTTNPWRIGGKSLTGVDRTLYSKTAISDDITKIEVTHGEASSITVNSWTVIVSKNSDFSNPVNTLTPTFTASTTTIINRPDGVDWSNCYFKFVYNVSVSGSSNKFLEFTEAKFYKASISYTIAAESNNTDYGTVALSDNVITGSPKSGCRYADPAYTVSPANSATVVQEGNEFTVTPSENTTVTIIFEAIPTHTVTFSVNGTTTTQDFMEGAAITFPTNPADINGKKFMGWVEATIDGTTDNKPDFVTSATMLTNDVTYYAVFATVTPGTSQDASMTITPSTQNIPTGYGDANTFNEYTLNGVKFKIQQMYKNGEKLQWRAAGNASGTGTMYNEDALQNIQSVVLTYDASDSNKNFTLKVGDEKNPTGGTAITPTNSGNVYTFDCSSYNKDYFVLTNGSNAGYLTSIVINYQTGTPDTYSAYCTSVGDVVPVTGVTLAPTSKALFVGEEFDLEATVAPANATYQSVTWTSSDETKATVVNGHVTALAAGTPTITVTTTDGSFTATCDLTISNVAVTGVTLDKDAATIFTGSVGNTVQLTPTIVPANATIKTVSWESSDEAVATVDDNGLVTAVAEGTATITVTTIDGSFTATCAITVEIAPGSAENPYTVAQARDAIDANKGTTDVYVKGIVSQVDDYIDSKYITYWISDDGTTTNQFQVYKGLGISGANFSAVTDVKVGDKVVVNGNIKNYYSTYEFDKDNRLVSIETLNFTFGEDSYSVERGGDLTITASSNNSSGVITYSSSATDVAEINASTGVVTAKKEGETTITATIAAADGFPGKSINVTLTVTDSREAANISFANAEVFALDEDGTYTQAATVSQSDYDGTITYEIASSTSNNALIDDVTGELLFENKGTITVKATAGETATYKSNTATYTLKVRTTPTIVVADQIIAYNEIFTYDVASCVEGGTVTITSNNDNVVEVDEYDLRGIAVGTSTITVATAANDEYIEGSETFVLTVTAPVGGTTAMTADDKVLFHETFGDNSGSAREWDDSYSVKSGVIAVYSGITSYTVSNVKQGKNTTGSTGSGLNQSSSNTDAYIIIGPLNVADYENMTLTYQWNAASVKGTYSTSAYYATSSTGDYTEMSGTGTGATTFVERSYNLPAAAQVSTLYLKIVWNTSNTQGVIDEVELTCPESATVTAKLNASGYATFCSEYPLDFTNADGYTAWYISNVSSSNEITFTQITGSIKGGIGILLKGTPDANITISSANSDNTLSDNKLFGTLAPTNIAANQYYGLSGATFVKVNGGNIPAGKALLPADLVTESADGARLTFVFEEANGISAVESVKTMAEGYYNLQGQRVDTPKKGLYIVNGKKVIIK